MNGHPESIIQGDLVLLLAYQGLGRKTKSHPQIPDSARRERHKRIAEVLPRSGVEPR